MSGSNVSYGLLGRLRRNFVRLLATDGAATYVDGSVGRPSEPAPRSGNPYIDPTTGKAYPGAPGSQS